MSKRWQGHRLTIGGKFYTRDVRDGHVTVLRSYGSRQWSLLHNGKATGFKFKTAKLAMEHADDAECAG